ncbi:MAG: glycerol-3-phosphate dehydrogenase/oxidase [bacterium]
MTSSRRSALFVALSATPFDVLVIGGGITGAGTARDAALRGLRVALVEQADFASGTSSRSSRLVHGGVRYLEHGQVGLVFESSRERRTLLRIAPHLVRPLPFTWPVYTGARIGRWKLAAGLTLYDALALFRNVGRHQRLDARGVVAREPHVSQKNLTGGARYWDSATDDARLTLANVLSAERAGAIVANHARVSAILRVGNRIAGASVLDVGTGATVDIHARVVVNASGPWSDKVERLAQAGAASAVRGSKGVHVSVPRSRVGNVAALTLTAPQDGRVMFVLPSGAFTIIGTTDTFDDVAPDEVRANERDVAYLLESANHYFPDAALTRSDVVSAWAGLRPLAVAGGGGSNASAASREHAISEVEPGLVRVTGGKLTTFRSMASQVVDAVQRSLGGAPTKSRTAHEPLPGGDIADVALEIGEAARVIEDGVVAERLVHAYGSAWRDVWSRVHDDETLRTRIAPERPYLLAELRHAIDHEHARTFGDLLIRRTPVAFETQDHGRNAARRIAPSVSQWLGWSGRATESALAAYDAEVARIFTIDAAPRVPLP